MTVVPEPGPGRMNEEIFSTVANDVVNGLGRMFGGRLDGTSVAVHPAFANEELIGNEQIAVVPWIYYGRHDGDFQGMVRTERDVDVHGITFVDRRGDDLVLHRLVDWMGVITQLGVEVSWRVPVDEEQYRANRDRLREEDEREAQQRAEARAAYRESNPEAEGGS
jgi:hypothetical protein